MASFEFLAIILTGLGLTASLFYYSRVLENQNKTRKTQQYFEFLQSVSTPEFIERTSQFGELKIETFEDYLSITRSGPEGLNHRAYLTWLNGVGKMLEDGLLDKGMILSFGENIRYMRAWRMLQPFVYRARESNGLTWHLKGLESLYNIMAREWKDQGDPSKFPENLIIEAE